MAYDWLVIDSDDLDSSCDGKSASLQGALNGTDIWDHFVDENHWFVLDLGETLTIEKVKGRSEMTRDPTDVNIYIDDSNPPTTICEETISTWKNTSTWVEILLTTEGEGRYIKVEVEDTEFFGRIQWGNAARDNIFDAYGGVGVPPPARVPKPTVGVGNPLMF